MITTLDQVKPGRKVRVSELAGGYRFRERLASLGIGIGCELQVSQPVWGSGGSMLVLQGQSRLAIGHGMAGKILVEMVDQER